jgi:hypothetical protein
MEVVPEPRCQGQTVREGGTQSHGPLISEEAGLPPRSCKIAAVDGVDQGIWR